MRTELLVLSLVVAYPVYTQTDTLYLDPVSGNYVVRYVGVIAQEVGDTVVERDTLISFVYEPPTKIDPIIEAFVTRESDSTFLYRYKITNGPQAQQNLREFSLHFGEGVSAESRTPSTSWYNDRPKAGFGLANRWMWWGNQGLEATWFIDSCMLTSNGLPAITESYSRAVSHILVWPADQKDNSKINISAELSRLEVYPNADVLRKTVGPYRPPMPFIPVGFADTMLLYTSRGRSLNWILDQPAADRYTGLFTRARSDLVQNNYGSARPRLDSVLTQVRIDSATILTSEAYALLRFNTEYLLEQLPVAPPGLTITLINSAGTRLTNGTLQYYEGTWRDGVNNGDGTFRVNTSLTSVSLRMTYEFGSQTKSNVPVGPDTVVFQTVNAQVRLQNSQGAVMDTGTVQYYAGAWRSLGTTVNGIATKELLPVSYSFRMTYAGGSNDRQEDIGSNSTVVFQTVNASVQLQNSQGTLMDTGTVQYYAGAWRVFGTTANGIATRELLPNTYSFRMTYAFGSTDKQQNIGTNPTVVFQTINTIVQLKNSQGSFINQGTVQYYSGAWRNFGVTTNGVVTKELLPANYTFRMRHESVSMDKAQNISTNNTVSFATVLCTVRVRDSQGEPVNNVQASYYSTAWLPIGSTVNGETTKELLPATLTFRITYGTSHQDKPQNLSTNVLVEFIVQQ